MKHLIAVYPELVGTMAKRNLTRTAVAKQIGISTRTFYSKLIGETEFTLSEAKAIRNTFFPDMPLEALFAQEERDSA